MAVAAPPSALVERALTFLAMRETPVAEAELLAHVYGAPVPPGLAAALGAPLRADLRLARTADGGWMVARVTTPISPADRQDTGFIALAISTTSARPDRGRIVALSAVRIEPTLRAGPHHAPAFDVRLDPAARVPRYAARRGHLDRELFEGHPPFAAIASELFDFLGDLPVWAQEAAQAWEFIRQEARRAGLEAPMPPLRDVNSLADHLLDLRAKPTLAVITAALGQPGGGLATVGGEAQAVARVAAALLERAAAQGLEKLDTLPVGSPTPSLLHGPGILDALPDGPGVYVMRGADDTPLYVGKARHLQRRVAAYVGRPLGVTRRFEGLADQVQRVEPRVCDNELEALVLEARVIQAHQPRFNTQRSLHPPRYWLCLPPQPELVKGRHPRALRRITRCDHACGQSLGPYRNEQAAEAARRLARDVFDLDRARTMRADDYEARLARAWALLAGDTDVALRQLRTDLEAAQAAHDARAAACLQGRLRTCLAYDYAAAVLPTDPRDADYAVVRADADSLEVFRIAQARLVGYARDAGLDPVSLFEVAAQVVQTTAPRTAPDDATIVLRWLGAQRPPARLVHLPADPDAAVDAIHRAALAVADDLLARDLEARRFGADA